jgi:hypothetical protein
MWDHQSESAPTFKVTCQFSGLIDRVEGDEKCLCPKRVIGEEAGTMRVPEGVNFLSTCNLIIPRSL